MQRRLCFALLLGMMMSLVRNATAASVSTLYSIKGSGDGASPQSDLVVVGNMAYGTTYAGGKMGAGSIFSLNLQTGAVNTLYSFPPGAIGNYPSAGLVLIGDKLYGTTAATYPNNAGTIFRFDPTTNALRTIYTGAPTVGDLAAAHGLLYAVTANLYGSNAPAQIVSFNPKTGYSSPIYSFDPSLGGPAGGLTVAGSTLYGTMSGGSANENGFVYKIDIPTATESVVWSFNGGNNDGCYPSGHLAVSGSMLYGTTPSCGANGEGTVFGINLTTDAERVIYSFRGTSKDGAEPRWGVVVLHGLLYGVAQGIIESGPDAGEQPGSGTVFSVKPTTGEEVTLHAFAGLQDGGVPEAGLTVINGLLYGSTAYDGTFGSGTLFSIDPATRVLTNVHEFSGVDGNVDFTPGLIGVGNALYGTTSDGGPSGGTVFKIAAATGTPRTVFDFTGTATGATPNSSLVSLGGMLYGTTGYGGPNGAGTVFAIDPTNGKQTVIYAFQGGTDGVYPGNLVALGSTLYGTTGFETTNAPGTVFAIDPTTGAKSILHVFNSSVGTPNSLIAFQNELFGTTDYGATDEGSIFRLDPTTKAFRIMHKFGCGSDGCIPFAGMIDFNGNLVGTTYYGGAHGAGVVFSFDPTSGTVSNLYSFGANSTDGTYPEAALLQVGNMLYGTTSSGGSGGGGTVFQLDPDTQAETILYNFGDTALNYPASAGGYFPLAALFYTGGVFYGTTSAGGAGNAGAVFSLTP